jgi:uncharacterized protein (TIGR03086 family)
MSIDLLETAIDGFTRALDATPDADFDTPTMCAGWDVTSLLRHVVGGTVAANMALRGSNREEMKSVFPDFTFGSSMRADYAAAVEDHVRAFASLDRLDVIVQHPMMDMPASQLLTFRIVDFALHTWDLVAGMGRSVVLDEQVLLFCWDSLAPMADVLGATGVFGEGPSGLVPIDADLQRRVLDLTGRRSR